MTYADAVKPLVGAILRYMMVCNRWWERVSSLCHMQIFYLAFRGQA